MKTRGGAGDMPANTANRRGGNKPPAWLSEEYRQLIENVGTGVVIVDIEGRYLLINELAAAGFGKKPDEVVGKFMSDFLEPAVAARYLEENRRLIETCACRKYEDTFKLPIGERSFLIIDQCLRDENGKGYAVQSSSIDITERNRAQDALKRSEEMFRTLVETSALGELVTVGLDEKVEYVNPRFTEIFGYTLADIPDVAHWWPLAYPDPEYREKIRAEWTQQVGIALQNGTATPPIETLVICKDGSRKAIEFRLAVAGGKNIVSCTDLTDRRRAEEALEQAHEQLRQFVDCNIIGMLVAGADGRVLEANDYYLRVIGFSREEFERGEVDWRAITPPEWLPADEKAIRELREKGTCTPYEKEYVRRDGTRVPVMLFDAMLRGPEERIAAFMLDQTEKKRVEKSLKNSEEQYRTLIERSRDGIIIVQDSVVVFANQRMAELDGSSVEQIVGTPFMDHVHPDHVAAMINNYKRRMAGEELPSVYETVLQRHDGSPAPAELNASVVTYRGKPADMVSIRDISERKKAEEELHQVLSTARCILWQAEVAQQPDGTMRWNLRVSNEEAAEKILPHLKHSGQNYSEIWHSQTLPEDLQRIHKIAADALREGKSGYTQEFRCRVANGDIRWISEDAQIQALGPGRWMIVGVSTDVTERKREQEALSHAHESLTLAQHAAGAGTWNWDMATGKLEWSDELFRLFGLDPARDSASFELWRAAIHPDDRAAAEERIQAAIRDHVRLENEYRVVLPTGDVRWINALGNTHYDPAGRPSRMSGICIDITDRKRAEKALREAEARHRELAENINVGVAVYEAIDGGRDFVFKDFNRAGERIDHDDRQRLIGRSVLEVRPGIEQFGLLDVFRRVWRTGKPEHHPVTQYKDNAVAGWYENYVYKLPSGEIVAVFDNITERKQAEEALHTSEAQLSNALQISRSGHWEYDVASDMFTFNDNFYRIFRTTTAEVGGHTMKSADYARRFCHPDDAAMVANETRLAMEASDPNYSRQIEHRILYADGQVGWIAVRFFVVKNAQGRTVKTFGVNQDITESKKSEEALRESREVLQAVLNSIPVRVFWKDRDLKYLGCNAPFARDAGLERPEDLVGKDDYAMGWRDQAELYRADDRAVIENGKSRLLIEEPQTTPTGETIYLLTSKIPLRNADGTIGGVLGTYFDITERKRAEQALRESENLLNEVGRIAQIGGWTMDLVTRKAAWTRVTYELVGLRPDEPAPGPDQHLQYYIEEDRPKVAEALRALIEDDVPLDFEARAEIRGKGMRWFRALGQPVREAGRCVRVYGTLQDITESKLAEQKLHDSEEKLRLFIEHAPAALAMFDRDMRYLAASRRWITDFNLGDQSVIGQSHYEIFPGVKESWKSAHRRGLAGEVVKCDEDRFERADGSVQWSKWEVRPWHDATDHVGGIVISSEDITERKKTEEALRESQQRYRDLVEKINDVIFMTAADGTIIYASPALKQILGYEPAEVVGRNYNEFLDPRDRESVRLAIEDTLAGKLYPSEFRMIHKSGEKRWIRTTSTPVPGDAGPVGLRGVLTDITERKQVEEDLKESEKRLSEAQRMARLGYWTWDVKTGDVEWSDEVYRIFRLDPETFKPQIDSILALSPWPEDHERDKELIRRATANREKGSYEQRFLRPDHSIGHYASTFEGRYDEQGNLVSIVGTVQDITERKQAERMQVLSAGVLDILNKPMPLQEAAAVVLALIKRETGLDAAGIRLKQGEDFPYLSAEGLTEDFISAENSLVARNDAGDFCREENGRVSLECTCGLVISEKCGPPSATVTPSGSFWTSDAESLAVLLHTQDPRLRPRDRCLLVGFMSLALIPIRVEHQVIGLLHLAGKQKGMFTAGTVRFFEGLAASVGIAIARKQAEEGLSLAELRYRTLFEQSPDGVVILDPATATFVNFNDQVCRQLGYTREEFARLTLADIDVVETPAATRTRIDGILRSGRSDFETRHRTKQGEIRDVQVTAQSIEVEGKTIYHCIWRDITERNRAENAVREQSEFLQRMIDSMPYPVFYKDNECRYLGCNRAFEQFFGVKRADIVGKLPHDIAPKELADVYLKSDRELLAHPGTQAYDSAIQSFDGTRHDVIFHKATFEGPDGKLAGLIGAVLDITDRKKAEGAVQEQLAELRRWHEAMLGREGRVIELKREVNELLAKAGRPARYESEGDLEGPQAS